MRPTKEKSLENRRKIVAAAAELFRKNGISETGVDAITRSVGLTHGGFYGHFRSKEALLTEAMNAVIDGHMQQGRSCLDLADFADKYLSATHRDSVGQGCILASLGPELARQKDRAALTRYVEVRLEQLAALRTNEGELDEPQAIVDFSTMLGAIILARLVENQALSDRILATVRHRFSS